MYAAGSEHQYNRIAQAHIVAGFISDCVLRSESKQYNEALTAYGTALELAKQRGDSIAVQDDLQVTHLRPKALAGPLWLIVRPHVRWLDCITVICQVDIVRLLYTMGGVHKDAAATLIMNVLRSNDHHQNALIVYAKMASERGMVRDAVQVLIRVLIRAPDDQEIR